MTPNVADFGDEGFEQGAWLGRYHADRLVFFEDDRCVRAREAPVHGECCDGPIGFDDSFERGDSIFLQIRGAANVKIESGRRAKEEGEGEGKDAFTEMADGGTFFGLIEAFDTHAGGVPAAGPGCANGLVVENPPAGLIGDQKGQTTISDVLPGVIHPLTRARGADERHSRPIGNAIGD